MDQWPKERWCHASSIITGSSPILVVMGGFDQDDQTFDDDGCWLMDVSRCSWTKVLSYLHIKYSYSYDIRQYFKCIVNLS